MKKRILSVLLAACIILPMLPATAWAAPGFGPPTVTTSVKYTLNYDANGGSKAPVAQTKEVAAVDASSCTFTISTEELTREGFTFLGWADSDTATAAQYQPGGSITLNSDDPSVTLYALWMTLADSGTEKPDDPYYIFYVYYHGFIDEDGNYFSDWGEYDSQTRTITFTPGKLFDRQIGDTICIFKGWSTENGGNVVYDGSKMNYTFPQDTNQLSLYAVWQVITDPGSQGGSDDAQDSPEGSPDGAYDSPGGSDGSPDGANDSQDNPGGLLPIPSWPGSPIQNIVKEETDWPDWIDRVTAPEYAMTLYELMAGRAADSHPSTSTPRTAHSIFETEGNFVLSQGTVSPGEASSGVEEIEVVEFALADTYSSGGTGLNSTLFQDEKFYTVGVTEPDRRINYPALELGDVVRTENFNGVYVTSIPRDENYEAKKKETCEYIAAVFHAFDRDCPEIFWLNGRCKVRITSLTNPSTGGKEAYFFLVMADKDGFTMRSPDWEKAGSIEDGIRRRDEAVAQILTTVTSGDVAEQIKQLNKWLTEHNQYNTSGDLTAIGNEPHECLSALEGRIGEDGPVCDGYSRAFKVLCDRLEIPCILETGWARPTRTSEPEFHMWNSVKVGEVWYGADITWDDPSVKGFVGAKSGRENENFLLVGTDTIVLNQAFNVSHVAQNQAAAGGVAFDNSPVMSATAFSAIAYGGYYTSLYDDVPAEHWAAEAVAWAKSMGYMVGVSPERFSPGGDMTREQLWTVLARLAGEPVANYEEARAWAVEAGLTDGSAPHDSATRQDTVTFLYGLAKLKDYRLTGTADLAKYQDAGQTAPWAKDAMEWAVGNGVVEGTTPTTLEPGGKVTRAQFAMLLQRFCKNIVQS